jgi:hypothetical protein
VCRAGRRTLQSVVVPLVPLSSCVSMLPNMRPEKSGAMTRAVMSNGGNPNDDPYPPQRIGQRLCEPRNRRERGSASNQLQKSLHEIMGKLKAHGRRECSAADFGASIPSYGPSPVYWITRSARLSTSGGIVTPMSRAVLRFTISS